MIAVLASGCAHAAKGTSSPGAASAWIEAPVVGDAASDDRELATLADGDLHARTVRLDRLLDLFDAARFGDDADARETLWNALGGHATGIGEDASRDALRRLLTDAMALDESGALDQDDRDFVAAAIMLLTTDLQPPASADDLVIRTLAFRTLAESGHPRIADNARWRLYDHARGTLQGATEAPPAERLDVAVQALYVDHESLEAWLADAAPHAKPPTPPLPELWRAVTVQSDALAADARWRPVVDRRRPEDERLRETLASVLPAPRQDDWPLALLPAGTAAAESGAPVLWMDGAMLVVDAGHPDARRVGLDDDPEAAADAIRNVLAQDGRGVALWVSDPAAAAPRVAAALRAVRRSGASALELAVHEPRVRAEAPPALLALPMLVVRDSDATAGASAARQARIHVHLAGTGPVFAVDDRVLPRDDDPTRAEGQLDAIAAAYPDQRVVRLTLGPDVQLRQLIDLLSELRRRSLTTVAWHVDGTAPTSAPDAAASEVVARRAALGRATWRAEVTPPFSIKAEDQARLEAFVESLAPCLVELETAVPSAGVSLVLPLSDAALGDVETKSGKGVSADARGRLDICVATKARGFRLVHHRDTMRVTAKLLP
jgi:hypothetical protein